MQLPHGYTNDTYLDNGTVTKRYSGSDAEERLTREVAALQNLQDAVPVPTVLHYDMSERLLQTGYLVGRHGQELIDEGHASEVLYSCGSLLQRLQSIPPQLLSDAVPDNGKVIVHGDFGPQNLLIDPDRWTVRGVLDWEWVHLGDPIEDLAWAEWIVRTHHPHAIHSLSELFRGYGSKPPWRERHAAMSDKCDLLLSYSKANSTDRAVILWEERVQQTAVYQEFYQSVL